MNAIERATRTLRAAGVQDAEVDAEWLVAHVLGVTRSEARLQTPEVDQEVELFRLVARRARREPLQYVLGEWAFRRLTLKVDRRALIPRPETEVLVERCLALLRTLPEGARVLDVGVGSGAIALAIKDEHPSAYVVGVDTDADALSLAQENADRTGIDVDLHEETLDALGHGWDLVVSNPPYVRPDEYASLEPELRDWEPYGALVGSGLHAEIARRARTRFVVFEVGDGQAGAVAETLRGLGYEDVGVSADLTGKDRVVEGRRA